MNQVAGLTVDSATQVPQYPRISIKCFDHIQMDVANLEESIEFYRRVFGFSLKEVGLRAMVRWAIIGNEAQLYLCLHEFAEGKGVKNEGLEITHFGLVVDNFDAVLETLKLHNVATAYDHAIQYHSSKSIYFFDPNGYKIEISENRGGGIDSMRPNNVLE
ncbi:VOC family protein [Agrobacterium sp. 22-226-1]